MTGRVTTRAGRKIRHVAPGPRNPKRQYAGEYFHDADGAWWLLNQQRGWVRLEWSESRALRAWVTAQAACTLVRALVAIGAQATCEDCGAAEFEIGECPYAAEIHSDHRLRALCRACAQKERDELKVMVASLEADLRAAIDERDRLAELLAWLEGRR